MVSIKDFPVEILLQIIEKYLLRTRYNPVIGRDASWLMDQYLLTKQLPALPNLELLDSLPYGELIGDEKHTSTLKALRLVDRAFKALVEPYIFREMHLLYDWSPLRTEKLLKLMGPHWQYIQVIHANVDDPTPKESDSTLAFHHCPTPNPRAKHVAAILRECHNLQELGLYYYSHCFDLAAISHTILSLLENGRLTSLGLYSHNVLSCWALEALAAGVIGSMGVICGIAASEKASRALKKLDIATEWMPKEIYNLIRSSRFSSLESLTVRYSFQRVALHDPDPAQRNKWCPNANLVCLQLINCETVYAPDIPLIVQNFENLTELLVSGCGYHEDVPTVPPEPGWSRLPDALCQNRPSLRLLTIEHVVIWEMRELGRIPTTTLVCANLERNHLIDVLESDDEMFPGLALLRVLPDNRVAFSADEGPLAFKNDEGGDEGEDEELVELKKRLDESKKRLDAVCSKRGVEVKRNARSMVY